MWTVLDERGVPVFWHPVWDRAVSWAMRMGGELDILFQPFAPGSEGDVDENGDLA